MRRDPKAAQPTAGRASGRKPEVRVERHRKLPAANAGAAGTARVWGWMRVRRYCREPVWLGEITRSRGRPVPPPTGSRKLTLRSANSGASGCGNGAARKPELDAQGPRRVPGDLYTHGSAGAFGSEKAAVTQPPPGSPASDRKQGRVRGVWLVFTEPSRGFRFECFETQALPGSRAGFFCTPEVASPRLPVSRSVPGRFSSGF